MKLAAIALAFAALTTIAHAQPAPRDPACPSAPILGPQLITDICWGCIFPIRLFGKAVFGEGQVPSRASKASVCLCWEGVIPRPGIVMGLWEPARLIEVVRTPGCMPTLGGMRIDTIARRQQGSRGKRDYDTSDRSFSHVHVFAFPLLVILDIAMPARCIADGYMDFDLIYLSELDPTWNLDELAFFTHPEAALVATPLAQSACMADAAAVLAGEPIDELFWCAGSWGSLYPLVGRHVVHSSMQSTVNRRAKRTPFSG